MEIIIRILSIFMLFCFLGWCLEVCYRSIRNKRLINPGFMVGVTLPIYGLGALILYGVFSIPLSNLSNLTIIIIKVLIASIFLTLIEFLAGFISLKVYHNRLWDYSDRKFNIMGLVCLEFSIYWTLLAIFFYFVFYPWLQTFSFYIYSNTFTILLLGVFYGIFIVDLIYSLKLLDKIRGYALQLQQTINFENLKRQASKRANNGLTKIKSLAIFKLAHRVSVFLDEENQKIQARKNKSNKD